MGDIYWKELGRTIFPAAHHCCIFGSKGASKSAPLDFFNEAVSKALQKARIYCMSAKLITSEDLDDCEAKFNAEQARRDPSNHRRARPEQPLVEDEDLAALIQEEMEELQQSLSAYPDYDVGKQKFVKSQHVFIILGYFQYKDRVFNQFFCKNIDIRCFGESWFKWLSYWCSK